MPIFYPFIAMAKEDTQKDDAQSVAPKKQEGQGIMQPPSVNEKDVKTPAV